MLRMDRDVVHGLGRVPRKHNGGEKEPSGRSKQKTGNTAKTRPLRWMEIAMLNVDAGPKRGLPGSAHPCRQATIPVRKR